MEGADVTWSSDVSEATLGPGGEAYVVATWSPTVTGPWSATVVIESDDPRRPRLSERFGGTGLTPPPSPWNRRRSATFRPAA